MNIIGKTNAEYELLIETLDDLWVLSQIINTNDRVFGKTERKIKIGSETNYKVTTKTIYVDLLVDKVKFEDERLKILGKIQNENEYAAIGSAQTLNYNAGDKIKFEKKNMLKFEQKLLDNAVKSKKSQNLLILFDKDTLYAIEFSNISYKILFKETNLGSKKTLEGEVNEEEQKYNIIKDLLKKDYSKIIFASPSIYKDKLQKYLKDKTGLKTITFSWTDVSSNAVLKVIEKINQSGILSESQIAYEMEHINKLLENISKKTKSTYGLDNITQAINSGSCETLLLSTDFMNNEKEKGNYENINNLIRTVEKLNGNLVIVNSKNQSGKILDGLTGIAGILRY